MARFKVGDKVVRAPGSNDPFYKWLPRKDFYVVTAVSAQGERVQVDWVMRNPADKHPWHHGNFELYQEVPSPKQAEEVWDPSVAATLRRQAERCVKQYNDYIKLQPKQLQPITIQ